MDRLSLYQKIRAFNLPLYEVENYFIWRQKDWFRNSIQMLAQSQFSHKELYKKKTSDMKGMLINHEIVNYIELFNPYVKKGNKNEI